MYIDVCIVRHGNLLLVFNTNFINGIDFIVAGTLLKK